MTEDDKISLKDMVKRFVNFSASQLNLYYTEKTVATFLAGMAASKTMILEGISGTGKTSLPYAFGKFFENDADIISVQPSWRDRFEMMGYLNEFTKRFNETDFLRAIYEATYRNDIVFIVLDEMNLARVEYYFADFLSLLEMPSADEWLLDIVPDKKIGDPLHLEDGKLLIPQNIWFVGTANKDDSTFTITDKVYDRSASIEMNDKAVPIQAPKTDGVHVTHEYMKDLFDQARNTHSISQATLDNLSKLDKFITEKFEITFGNRIMKQIMVFLPTYMACGGHELDGLDYIVARKIIRKFESLNLPFLQKELEELVIILSRLFGKDAFKESKQMIQKYMKQM
jgi:5-methylcytosine-specific restriction endonuclease McrBC GTP-binding regulatory subunit McrB